MILEKGTKVMYKPGLMRRGVEQPARVAEVHKHYEVGGKIRIKCEGEKHRRIIQDKYVTVIS